MSRPAWLINTIEKSLLHNVIRHCAFAHITQIGHYGDRYARTSTIEQVAGLQAQIRDLKAAGAKKLFRENVSSVAPRKQLEAAIEFAREGDTLVVTKIDRLARSVRRNR